jgi:glycosyltransferase involved in cell wall biosynthesis
VNAAPKCISVITPVYNEEENVRDCHAAVARVFAGLPQYDYEHIFCDNASGDRTVAVLRELAASDARVRVIVNARNFGPSCSTFNGLMSARGDAAVVLLPVDLQDPPEVIPEFVRHWENGHEVAYGIRANREEGWTMRTVRGLYYRLVNYCAGIHIPLNVGDFQLIDRVVIEALRACDDYYPYIRGMIASCGFRAVGVPYTWKARRRGFSKNRLYHLIDQGLNGLISFTNVPMRLCLLAGFVLAVLSLLYAFATLILNAILGQLGAPGIPTLIVAIFFFAGIQLFFFGVLGEYISAIHFQVRKRPLVVERERINFPAPAGRPAEGDQAG